MTKLTIIGAGSTVFTKNIVVDLLTIDQFKKIEIALMDIDKNRLIKTKEKVRHEKLFRNDFKYNLFIPLSYNSNPVKLGKGSAIFLHLTRNYKATAGCIALKEKDFLILLKLIKKKTKILIN